MTYVYDLILNFNSNLYEFYEWNKDDKLYHVKRINLIKINSTSYNEILDNEIKLTDDFLLTIFNKSEYYENRSVLTFPYALLLTDSYRVMAVIIDMNGKITKYSSLMLDEEEDVLDISERLATIKLDYKIVKRKDECNDQTRYENHIIEYIKKDLDSSFKENNYSKLKYLYYEYFNKQNDDINKIYQDLMKELKTFNEKQKNLYNLIKLSYSHKNV